MDPQIEQPPQAELVSERRKYPIEPILFSSARLEIIKGYLTIARLQPERTEEMAQKLDYMVDQAGKTDHMTRFRNLAGLKDDLESAMGIARKTNTPLAILFIDGDKFKEVNDELSHSAGDKLIRAFANGINIALRRRTDMAARLEQPENEHGNEEDSGHSAARPGGDEFVVVLLGTDSEGAMNVVNRVQDETAAAADREVPEYRAHFNRSASVTIGIASFDPTKDQDWESLVKRADADMKVKKQQKGVAR